jgi:hypothetical protein
VGRAARAGAALSDWLAVVRRSARAWRRDAALKDLLVYALRLLRVNVGEAVSSLRCEAADTIATPALCAAMRDELLALARSGDADVASEACATVAIGLPLVVGAPFAQLTLVQRLLDTPADSPHCVADSRLLAVGARRRPRCGGRPTIWSTASCRVRSWRTMASRATSVALSPACGQRFKCTVCPDFDLCEACFYGPSAHADDSFRVIERPSDRVVCR